MTYRARVQRLPSHLPFKVAKESHMAHGSQDVHLNDGHYYAGNNTTYTRGTGTG